MVPLIVNTGKPLYSSSCIRSPFLASRFCFCFDFICRFITDYDCLHIRSYHSSFLSPLVNLHRETYLGMQCRLHELRNKERISVAAASKILANIVYEYKGQGLSMVSWQTREGRFCCRRGTTSNVFRTSECVNRLEQNRSSSIQLTLG